MPDFEKQNRVDHDAITLRRDEYTRSWSDAPAAKSSLQLPTKDMFARAGVLVTTIAAVATAFFVNNKGLEAQDAANPFAGSAEKSTSEMVRNTDGSGYTRASHTEAPQQMLPARLMTKQNQNRFIKLEK